LLTNALPAPPRNYRKKRENQTTTCHKKKEFSCVVEVGDISASAREKLRRGKGQSRGILRIPNNGELGLPEGRKRDKGR